MKKLLGFLGAFAISASASTSVVACQPDNALSAGEIDTALTELNGVSKDLTLSKADYATYTNADTTEEDKYRILYYALSDLYYVKLPARDESDKTPLDLLLRTSYAEFFVAAVAEWVYMTNAIFDFDLGESNPNAIDEKTVTNFTQFSAAFDTVLKIDGIRDLFIKKLGLAFDYDTDVEKTDYTDEQKNKAIESWSQKSFALEIDTINEKKEVVLYSSSINFSGNVPQLSYKGGMILNIVEGTE